MVYGLFKVTVANNSAYKLDIIRTNHTQSYAILHNGTFPICFIANFGATKQQQERTKQHRR
ncbi:hypothetical protein KAOT1_19157 [Kordia algicida OT-1]|uniref:Uncharacterized protein n=1 Tax=Kordia algicida OT-1 TaxID=391587 RepID=A9DNY4_9FLAO|nr:hypothetical protein KAOT1_19157 [Kordia algicida OT-1]